MTPEQAEDAEQRAVRKVGAIKLGLSIRRAFAEYYPYHRCWRCQFASLRWRLRHTRPLRLAVAHTIGGKGAIASHPQRHSRMIGDCLDERIVDFVEYLNEEIAFTLYSCQGDEDKPAHLVVDAAVWPSLRAWFQEHGLPVAEGDFSRRSDHVSELAGFVEAVRTPEGEGEPRMVVQFVLDKVLAAWKRPA